MTVTAILPAPFSTTQFYTLRDNRFFTIRLLSPVLPVLFPLRRKFCLLGFIHLAPVTGGLPGCPPDLLLVIRLLLLLGGLLSRLRLPRLLGRRVFLRVSSQQPRNEISVVALLTLHSSKCLVTIVCGRASRSVGLPSIHWPRLSSIAPVSSLMPRMRCSVSSI